MPELNITKNDELEYIWDLFMRQIEPVAATTPYMVGNGNHEAWLVGWGECRAGGACVASADFTIDTRVGSVEDLFAATAH